MEQPDLEALQLQLAQSMIEHRLLERALCGVLVVCFFAVLVSGSLAWYQWKSNERLKAAFLAEIKRFSQMHTEQAEKHANERTEQARRNSLEQQSSMMQVLHAYEGIAAAKRSSSGSVG